MQAARFVPPPPRQIPALLANLEQYWRSEELDPLVQLALVYFVELCSELHSIKSLLIASRQVRNAERLRS